MKKRTLVLLLLCLTLSGCTAAPPDSVIRNDTDRSQLISADTDALTPDSVQATLYFRYGDTEYLAPEERYVTVQRNETAEKALVQALIDGPAATSSSLSPLFPPDVEVLAVTSQDGTLFITFNEALLGRYADEPVDISSEPWKTELPLRRHLCMDSLTATLTEAGLCTQVQVLIYRSNAPASSMRLQAGYFDRGVDETLLPPLTRNEGSILTPHNTAAALLKAWMSQDWPSLYGWVARDSRPGEQTAIAAFAAAGILTGFEATAGTVAMDGQSAVLCADLTLRAAGDDVTRTGYPIHLVREDGLWRIRYDQLLAMIQEE
ncbi:MAG: GerMN domain-containing protein [Clostridia bacterium]|nr:GerMN domain-containing protein [Clostridia bacterium]